MSPLDRLIQFKFRVGRVYRVDVFVHWTLLAMAAWLLYSFGDDPKLGVLVILATWASIFLHELGHCWGARQVGGEATEVILWPLGGLAMIHAPLRPWPQFFSTLTGPLVNLLLIALSLPIYLVLGGTVSALVFGPFPAAEMLGFQLLYLFIVLNGILALFNIVPAFPMDGGRMLQAALWPRLGFHKALTVATYLAFVSAAVMIAGALYLGSLMLGLVGIFVIQGALQERAKLRYGIYDEELAMGSDPWAQAEAQAGGAAERSPGALARWMERRKQRRDEAQAQRLEDMRERLDEVLAKVSAKGMDGLTREERQFLERASKELRKRKQEQEQ